MTTPRDPSTQTKAARQTEADKRAENQRKIEAAQKAFLAVPQNVYVLTELAKR